jgi:hypothetical protein
MINATAFAFLTEKAFLNCGSAPSSDRPRRKLPPAEITPDKRTTGTIGLALRQKTKNDAKPAKSFIVAYPLKIR